MDEAITPFVRKEDIPKIVEAFLANDNSSKDSNLLPPSSKEDWPFLFFTAIDLGLAHSGEKVKLLKDGVRSGVISDGEALTQILGDWIERSGRKATWDRLVSVFHDNMIEFPGFAKKDYVTLLKELHPESQTEDFVGEVFGVDLIREEVYKYLTFREKKTLRLVCRRWWRLTLPDWRKSAVVMISNKWGISLEDFFGLFTKTEDGEWKEDTYLLVDYPYQNYHLVGAPGKYHVRPSPIAPPNKRWKECDKFFWEYYAPNIISLSFDYYECYENGFLEAYKWMILKACPNLESLSISFEKYNCVDDPERNKEEFKARTISTKLKILNILLDDKTKLDSYNKKEFLEIIPHVEKLTLSDITLLEGLCIPGGTRKLKDFTLNYTSAKSFHPLNMYLENYHDTIKQITLNYLNFSRLNGTRASPFSFHPVVSKFGGLTSLELDIERFDKLQPWIIEFSTTQFPNLKKFGICFRNFVPTEYMRFDFESLKGMRKLESLTVGYLKPLEGLQRRRRAQDYLYVGPRDIFVPEGFPIVEHPPKDKILLENLKEFGFNGWPLENRDLEIFSRWFPNLKELTAILHNETVAYAMESFSKLESLTLILQMGIDIDREELFDAKLDHEGIRLFTFVKDLGKFEVMAGEGETKTAYLRGAEEPYFQSG